MKPFQSIKAAFNRAGGLNYHYQYLRFGHRWPNFSKPLNRILLEWAQKCQRKKLLILAASGGYNLNRDFLNTFDSIQCIDPDPFAARIVRKRMKSIPLSWDFTDYLGTMKNRFSPEGLTQILDTYPDHALLVSNFFGQAGTFCNNETWVSQLQTVWNQDLAGHERASFHDIYSTIFRL